MWLQDTWLGRTGRQWQGDSGYGVMDGVPYIAISRLERQQHWGGGLWTPRSSASAAAPLVILDVRMNGGGGDRARIRGCRTLRDERFGGHRLREIALRMALGASPRRVARAVVMESLVLAVAGGAIGMVGAAASGRVARTLLFGVAPQDPVTLVTAVAVLLVVVVAASWLPARRAALIDPARAMRM